MRDDQKNLFLAMGLSLLVSSAGITSMACPDGRRATSRGRSASRPTTATASRARRAASTPASAAGVAGTPPASAPTPPRRPPDAAAAPPAPDPRSRLAASPARDDQHAAPVRLGLAQGRPDRRSELKNYRETIEPRARVILLLSPPVRRTLFRRDGLWGAGLERRASVRRYGMDGARPEADAAAAAGTHLGQRPGPRLPPHITVDDRYMFTVRTGREQDRRAGDALPLFADFARTASRRPMASPFFTRAWSVSSAIRACMSSRIPDREGDERHPLMTAPAAGSAITDKYWATALCRPRRFPSRRGSRRAVPRPTALSTRPTISKRAHSCSRVRLAKLRSPHLRRRQGNRDDRRYQATRSASRTST